MGAIDGEGSNAAYQIKHLPLDDQIMKRVHDLFDRGGPIPPVHVQDVDIRGAQLLEGCLDGDVEGLGVIPGVIHPVGDFVLSPLEVGCVLKMTSAR
jgi:hypothetical protein